MLLHEGITEAGSTASWTAAGTSYATHGEPMIPLYIFYSMFGFQRTGDGLWAAADQMTRGFLLGATAGRTTLNGEGLQHQDGHSLLLASTNPACVAYDAAYAFELGHIVARRRCAACTANPAPVRTRTSSTTSPSTTSRSPSRPQPARRRRRRHPRRDAPLLRRPTTGDGPRAQILASGIACRGRWRHNELLQRRLGRRADVWSVTSWTELRRDALAADDWNLTCTPTSPAGSPTSPAACATAPGPVVAVSDWMRAVPDQIAPFVPGAWSSLGTDGFGRSDTRGALRRHFSVDAPSIALRVLEQLVARGELDSSVLSCVAPPDLDDVPAAPDAHGTSE